MDILFKVLDGYYEFQLHIYVQRKLFFRFSSNFFENFWVGGWMDFIFYCGHCLQGLVTLHLYIFALKYTQAIK